MTGDPPVHIKKSDIRSFVSAKDTLEDVASIVSAFIVLTRQGIDHSSSMESYRTFQLFQSSTDKLLNPIFESLVFEGNMWTSDYEKIDGTPWVNNA